MLHLLALVERAPRRSFRAIDGRVAFVRVAPGLIAAVEPRRVAAPMDERSLLAHDAAIRRLCASTPAVVPARFAAPFADEDALREALYARYGEIKKALALVRGREQMSLRVLRLPHPERADSTRFARSRQAPRVEGRPGKGRPGEGRRGAGRRFLEARREALVVPALDPVRRALGSLIRAERVEPHTAPPLLATVHHLVDRGDAEAYRERVAATLASGEAPLLAVRGPFPPYAFASGDDA